MTAEKLVEEACRVMLATIDQEDVYLGPDDDMSAMTIDGIVNVTAMARAATALIVEKCAQKTALVLGEDSPIPPEAVPFVTAIERAIRALSPEDVSNVD